MYTEQAVTDEHYKESVELCELLPWYVNRTLDDEQLRAVEQHLQHCKVCAEDLPVLRAVRESMHNEPVAVLLPKPDAEQFLADAGGREQRPRLRRTVWISFAAAASVAVMALTMTWFLTHDSEDPPTLYETATNAGGGTAFDYVLHIAFDADSDPQAHDEVLNALAPLSVGGPDSFGNYRVVIRLPARSVDELQNFTRDIESNSSVSSAAIVAVELPVESR